MTWLIPLAMLAGAALVARRPRAGAGRDVAELLEVTGAPGVPNLHARANVRADQRVTLLFALGPTTVKRIGARVVAVRAAPGVDYTGLLLDPVWEGLPAGSFVDFGARHVAAIG